MRIDKQFLLTKSFALIFVIMVSSCKYNSEKTSVPEKKDPEKKSSIEDFFKDKATLRERAINIWEKEYDELGKEDLYNILDRGKRHTLESVLLQKGALIIPHVHIGDCGDQVATVVQSVFKSGKDTVLFIGVLHPMEQNIWDAAIRVFKEFKSKFEEEPLRGIYGPDLEGAWKLDDHSAYSFRRMLKDEAERRGVSPPTLIVRYPFLTGPHPETLPGFNDLKKLAEKKNVVLVSTGDLVHHGVIYGHGNSTSLSRDEDAMRFTRSKIEKALSFLNKGNYEEFVKKYNGFTVSHSDWADVGPVLRALVRPSKTNIISLLLSDFSSDFVEIGVRHPSWAAETFMQMVPQP